MPLVNFLADEPQILKLSNPVPTIQHGLNFYDISDGRVLAAGHLLALMIHRLGVRPDEEISITLTRQMEWVVCLTPRAEKARAAEEIAAQELRARQLAEETRQNPGRQLESSLAALRQMPKSANSASQERAEEPRGNGTTGPAPAIAVAPRRAKGEVIPFNLAFREVVGFVCAELNASGEQWSEQSRQDLVATVLIAGSKAGYVGVWERER